jgi:uncharacterized protein (DUF488 family)
MITPPETAIGGRHPVPETVLTIGHSNHAIGRFLELLRGADVTTVADVRSVPASRRLPHFNRAALARALAEAGISYVHLGDTLGGRPKDPACYRDGQLDYDLVAATDWFAAGLSEVETLAGQHRLVLMCAEREPLDCHRFLLVARHLGERGAGLGHILADGRIEPQAATERRLLEATGLGAGELFADTPPPGDLLSHAYARRSERLLRGRQLDKPAR